MHSRLLFPMYLLPASYLNCTSLIQSGSPTDNCAPTELRKLEFFQETFFKILFFCVFSHKIQAQVGLSKNRLNIPWIQFSMTLNLGNINLIIPNLAGTCISSISTLSNNKSLLRCLVFLVTSLFLHIVHRSNFIFLLYFDNPYCWEVFLLLSWVTIEDHFGWKVIRKHFSLARI